MPFVNANGKNIFFAHVPKTGGSSVEDYLYRRFGPLSIIDKNKREGVRGTGLIVPSTHLTTVDLAELLPRDLAHSFTVVREPMARMMSEYRYQSGVSRMSRMGFSTWLHIMIAAAQIEPRVYENHIRPQSDLVPEGCEIFRLEDSFDPVISWLDTVTGSTEPEINVGHLLKRKHETITPSRQDVDLVTRYYAIDYERFGYQPIDISDLRNDLHFPLRGLITAALARAIVLRQKWKWVQ